MSQCKLGFPVHAGWCLQCAFGCVATWGGSVSPAGTPSLWLSLPQTCLFTPGVVVVV